MPLNYFRLWMEIEVLLSTHKKEKKYLVKNLKQISKIYSKNFEELICNEI